MPSHFDISTLTYCLFYNQSHLLVRLWIRNFYCSTRDRLPCQSLERINPWTRKILLKYHFESELRQSIPSPVAILRFPSLCIIPSCSVRNYINIGVFPSSLRVTLLSYLLESLLFICLFWFLCYFFVFLPCLLFIFFFSFSLSRHMIPTSSKLIFLIFFNKSPS